MTALPPFRLLRPAAFALLAGPMLAACTDIPELDATVPAHLKQADYPALVPLDGLLTPLPPPQEQADALRAELETRRDGLQQRARQMNAPVVDDATAARMRRGVAP